MLNIHSQIKVQTLHVLRSTGLRPGAAKANTFFALLIMSHIQIGFTDVKNARSKLSRLGIFTHMEMK
jgi:hypothetical protein